MKKFTIVGERELLLNRIKIAERVIDVQADEIAQLHNEIHNLKDQIFALRLREHNNKNIKRAKLSVVNIVKFPSRLDT